MIIDKNQISPNPSFSKRGNYDALLRLFLDRTSPFEKGGQRGIWSGAVRFFRFDLAMNMP